MSETPTRTCYACGIAEPTDRVKLTPDELRGGEHLWGVCAACDIDTKALSAAVVAELLELPAGDEVLADIHPVRFAERSTADPSRPNRRPWEHVDKTVLADHVTARRRDMQRRQSDTPCHFCGTTVTPRGRWQRTTGTGGNRSICGACQEQLSNGDARDRAAAVLGGLTNARVTRIPHRLGSAVELLFWHETGRSTGSTKPWSHVDIRRLRSQIKELADQRKIGELPNWWDPDRVVKW